MPSFAEDAIVLQPKIEVNGFVIPTSEFIRIAGIKNQNDNAIDKVRRQLTEWEQS